MRAADQHALRTEGIDVQVVEMEGRGHEDVVNPLADAGKATLGVIKGVLNSLHQDP